MSTIKDADGWHCIYAGWDGTNYHACYAHSSDGATFTKPNLGYVSYDGSTDNNILVPPDANLAHAMYEKNSDKWVLLVDTTDHTDTKIYTADAPDGPYTLVKTLTMTGETPEPKGLTRRDDGRWLLYYNDKHLSADRSMYAWLSDSNDLSGDWTHQGQILDAPSSSNQYYSMGVQKVDDIYYGFVNRYSSTSKQLWIDLFVSHDGLDWTEKQASWLDVGAAGAWDDEMVIDGKQIAVDGDSWHLYYTGSPEGHDGAHPRDSRIGRATIGRRRIGQVASTGNVVTRQYAPTSGATLTVNADASGGTLDIEVLDQAGDPLAGYTQADFDTITTDGFDHVPTWGGQPMPTEQTIRLKFVLSGVTLYGYVVN